MTEQATLEHKRAHLQEPLYELALQLVNEMGGEKPEQRLDWLMNQDVESFGQVLCDINATARGMDKEDHHFDGEGVVAGQMGGSIPPDQEDKVDLLSELLDKTRSRAEDLLERGVGAQTVMTEMAVTIPTVINKLHLFGDGNGRTSRTLRMLLRDGDQVTPDRVEALVQKRRFQHYDTTPSRPVESAVSMAIRHENGTTGLKVIDTYDGDFTSEQANQAEIRKQLPGIDARIVAAYADTNNFNETVRLMSLGEGLEGSEIPLDQVLTPTLDPAQNEKFLAVYRGVRKQRAEVLMKALLEEIEAPMLDSKLSTDVLRWINDPRTRLGLDPIDPTTIHTVKDFQTCFLETVSPPRSQAA